MRYDCTIARYQAAIHRRFWNVAQKWGRRSAREVHQADLFLAKHIGFLFTRTCIVPSRHSRWASVQLAAATLLVWNFTMLCFCAAFFAVFHGQSLATQTLVAQPLSTSEVSCLSTTRTKQFSGQPLSVSDSLQLCFTRTANRLKVPSGPHEVPEQPVCQSLLLPSLAFSLLAFGAIRSITSLHTFRASRSWTSLVRHGKTPGAWRHRSFGRTFVAVSIINFLLFWVWNMQSMQCVFFSFPELLVQIMPLKSLIDSADLSMGWRVYWKSFGIDTGRCMMASFIPTLMFYCDM